MSLRGKSSEETELSVLKEILKWTKFSGMRETKAVLESALNDDKKRAAYQLSDGTRGTVEVGKLVGIGSTATIFKLWKSWRKLGLGEHIAVKGGERFKRSFDLEEFGIEVLEVATIETQKSKEVEDHKDEDKQTPIMTLNSAIEPKEENKK